MGCRRRRRVPTATDFGGHGVRDSEPRRLLARLSGHSAACDKLTRILMLPLMQALGRPLRVSLRLNERETSSIIIIIEGPWRNSYGDPCISARSDLEARHLTPDRPQELRKGEHNGEYLRQRLNASSQHWALTLPSSINVRLERVGSKRA